MFMCRCACAGVEVETREQPSVLVFGCCILFGGGSISHWLEKSQIGQVGQAALGICLSPPFTTLRLQTCVITSILCVLYMCVCVCLHGFLGFNLGPHVFTATTLLTEPTFKPQNNVYLKQWSKNRDNNSANG